ncbi:MAG: hypothetical protein JW751_20850 [Polyangiaceae bacterium]|nr:hypothetical protein [Polyangiaceae bacterium]
MDRIVVCFRWRGAVSEREAGGATPGFEAAVRSLLERRVALGGRIVAWHSRSFAFDFPLGAHEDAISLLVGDAVAEASREGFGVGVAQGGLVSHYENGAHLALSSGAALERAAALASIADPGDVLLDPALAAVRAGRLLTRGAQLGTLAGRRLRGLRLDPAFPWRRPESLAPLVPSTLVGPDPKELEVAPGSLGLMVAPRGSGATRVLAELASGVPRAFALGPWVVGEPLGAVREAFVRARVTVEALPPVHAATLEALLASEGAELEATGMLVAAWVGEDGLILVDDAAEVDADSLEAIAYACGHLGARVVARVLDQTHLPSPLAELPRAGSLLLGALDPDEAARLVRSVIDATMPDDVVARWARRGGGRPLAIVEAVRYGFESAELVRDQGCVVPRGRLGGRGGPQPARYFMLQRLRFLEDGERAALDALFALGGQARWEEIDALLAAAGCEAEGPDARSPLVRGGWIVDRSDTEVALASATLRDVLNEQLAVERRGDWLATASELRALTDGPLVAARAAVHALLAGRMDLGVDLARRAAAAARAVGLEATADALVALAEAGDTSGLASRGLTGGLGPCRLSRRGQSPASRTRASLLVEGTVGSEAAAVDPLSGRVADALRVGDRDAIAALAKELRATDERQALADRLEAMSSLRRGDVVTALRLARGIKAGAQSLDSTERCRAALTYAVTLGAAGRAAEALLEALDALARAREAGDQRGECAVARFLAQLNESVGHHEHARAWRSLGELSCP